MSRFTVILNSLWLLFFASLVHAKQLAPASLFFSPPDMVTAALSPNGEKIVAIRVSDGVQKLVLINALSGKEITLLDAKQYTDNEASIHQLAWIDNRYLAVQFSKIRDGIEDLLDTQVTKRLLVVDTSNSIDDPQHVLSVRTNGGLVHPLRDTNNQILYAKSGIYSKVYRIDVSKLASDKKILGKIDKVDGGQFTQSNEVRSVEGYAIRWLFDASETVKAVLALNKEKNLELIEFDEKGTGKVLKTWARKADQKADKRKAKPEETAKKSSIERLVPIALTDTEHIFYCLDFDEDEERSVYSVNFLTDERELVYETGSYQIIDLVLSDTNKLLAVKVLKNGVVGYEYLDSNLGKSTLGGDETKFSLVSRFDMSLDRKKHLTYSESSDAPGEFTYVNEISSIKKVIGRVRPALAKKYPTRLIESSVKVDGLDIPYLLTLPEIPTTAKIPLIVMPHGGPIGIYDNRYYDNLTHFLAANGYAVLRVNFRGSGGYTKAFREAGKKQWGDKILIDIQTVTDQVVARPDIDSKRICALGLSYGGYAATMLLINFPDFYKCGVTIAGVSDVNLYVNSPTLTSDQQTWVNEYIGESSKEYEKLKAISPVYMVNKIRAPLFIGHGEKDARVDIEHAYRLELMMRKNNKVSSVYLDKESGHQFSDPDKSILLFEKVLSFVDEKISL